MPQPPTFTLLRSPAPGTTRPLPGRPGGTATGRPPKLKKLRLAFVLLGLAVLGGVSTVFGMLMGVASDLPALENQAEYRRAENSVLVADAEAGGGRIAKLTGNQHRVLLGEADISPSIVNAVVAIEDRRYYGHDGVDYQGIARALWQDLLRQSAAQGGSTITQQFVKNALAAQGERSVFQKLREAALAYQLERKWSKQKILTQYLNSVYFGNGAYGVESAVRTYFGANAEESEETGEESPEGDGDGDGDGPAAKDVRPHEAALLAAMIASPTAYDPIQNPRAAKERRDLVLSRMLEQDMITRTEYEEGITAAIPSEDEIDAPRPNSIEPYFSTWVTQQLVDDYGSGQTFSGGLEIKTTLDPKLQEVATEAIQGRLAGVGPAASMVVIENKTGEVKALVGGEDFEKKPFNLATNGHRQPGSAFKPFTLITALQEGISPEETFESRKKALPVPGPSDEKFVVNNYEDEYAGVASLASATVESDNSVYAELGLRLGTEKIAGVADRMGIRTPISTNPAMTLGGLEQGFTPMELAFAYSTIANKGVKVSGTLASSQGGPVAIQAVKGAGIDDENELQKERVFSEEVGEQAHELLSGVVTSGTGAAAQIPGEFVGGKTGTTENYGDAWFVGFTERYTAAVWVGYADTTKYMKTEYHGQPVAGGTYPAEIWHDFMTAAIQIYDERHPEQAEDEAPAPAPAPLAPTPAVPVEPAPAPVPPPVAEPQPVAPAAPPPSPPPQPAPQPQPQAAPPPQPPPQGAPPPQN